MAVIVAAAALRAGAGPGRGTIRIHRLSVTTDYGFGYGSGASARCRNPRAILYQNAVVNAGRDTRISFRDSLCQQSQFLLRPHS